MGEGRKNGGMERKLKTIKHFPPFLSFFLYPLSLHQTFLFSPLYLLILSLFIFISLHVPFFPSFSLIFLLFSFHFPFFTHRSFLFFMFLFFPHFLVFLLSSSHFPFFPSFSSYISLIPPHFPLILPSFPLLRSPAVWRRWRAAHSCSGCGRGTRWGTGREFPTQPQQSSPCTQRS